MRAAMRQALEIICVALNRMEALDHDERDPIARNKLQGITLLLIRARSYLISADRQEVDR